MKIAVVGDSIAEGLGVKGRCYAELLCRALAKDGRPSADLLNLAYTAFQVSDSKLLLPKIINFDPDTVIVAHGVSEAIIRPRPSALRLVPPRWRQKGWLDPRPYYSRRPLKKLYQWTESQIRWRLKVALIKAFGGETWTTADAFEEQLWDFAQNVLDATRADVVLLTQCGVDDNFFPGSNASLQRYQSRVERIASRLPGEDRTAVCDVSSRLSRWADFFADHFHPNVSGHEKIARALKETIEAREAAAPSKDEGQLQRSHS